MAAVRSFDSYQQVKSLEKTGLKEDQAAAIINALKESRDQDLSQLATKDQLQGVKDSLEEKIHALKDSLEEKIQALDVKIEGVKIELKQGMQNMKTEIITEVLIRVESLLSKQDAMLKAWMLSMFIAIVGLTLAVVFKSH